MLAKVTVVVFEGTDGSGKTSLLNSVKKRLEESGYSVITYKTPSSTPTGNFAKEYGNLGSTDPLTRMLLFLANTVDDSSIIKERISSEGPDFCLIDRYYLCSVVYGLALIRIKYGKEVSKVRVNELVSMLENLGCDILVRPDAYVITDVDEKTRKQRVYRKIKLRKVSDFSYEENVMLQEEVRALYKEFSEDTSCPVKWVYNEDNTLMSNTGQVTDWLVKIRSEKT